MIASLDISAGPAVKSGSDAVKAGSETDTNAVGMIDFASLVGSVTLTSVPVLTPGSAEPALNTGTQAATGGHILPPTGNSLPTVPVLQNPDLLKQSAGMTSDTGTTGPRDLIPTAVAKLAGPILPVAQALAEATNEPVPQTRAPMPPPAERLEAIRQIMSPKLRAIIDRAASVMVQQLNAASEGISDKVAMPAIRSEATASLLQAAPVVPAPEGSPIVQPSTAAAATPTTGAATASVNAPQHTPHDFLAVLERLGEAREAVQTGRASLAVRHEDFGQVSLRLEAAGAGMKFALTSTDPDFAPVAQAALAERIIAERIPIERAERAAQAENSSGHSASDHARQDAQSRTSTARSNGAGAEYGAEELEHAERINPSAPKPPRDGALYA